MGRWRGQVVDTPSRWQELAGILEVSNFQEIAWKIWDSFKLPQWMSEIHDVENYSLAPPST